MKKFISIILSLILVLSTPVSIWAGSKSVISISVDEMKENAAYYIENALRQARNNATDKKPYTIKIPSGSYKLGGTLHIYSNTTLSLAEDTRLTKSFSGGNMLKAGVKDDTFTKYNGYRNIKIIGGVWDAGFSDASCAFRFAHCRNVTLKGLIIKNVKDAHHLELAAADGFTIDGCGFEGFKRTANVTGEAVQLDILHSQDHFPDYAEYDDTPCRNITIKNCRFRDLFAGVGTRSGVVGSYFTGIVIKNNTFEGISDKAISCFNYMDCTISGNNIDGATVGIMFEYYPNTNVDTRLYMPNDSSKKIKIKSDCKTVISGNKIKADASSGYNLPTGIHIVGGVNSSNNNIRKDKYIISAIDVKNNDITINRNNGRGIFLSYVQGSSISGNKLNCTASGNSADNGIMQVNGKNNSFRKNEVRGAFKNSFSFREGAKGSTLSANIVNGAYEHGVWVDGSSKITLDGGNRLDSAKSAVSVNTKTLNSPEKPSLSVKLSSKKPTLSWKRDKSASGYELYRSTSKNGKYTLVKAFNSNKKTFCSDSSASKNTKYYYKLRAYKAISGTRAYSPYSSVKSIKSK